VKKKGIRLISVLWRILPSGSLPHHFLIRTSKQGCTLFYFFPKPSPSFLLHSCLPPLCAESFLPSITQLSLLNRRGKTSIIPYKLVVFLPAFRLFPSVLTPLPLASAAFYPFASPRPPSCFRAAHKSPCSILFLHHLPRPPHHPGGGRPLGRNIYTMTFIVSTFTNNNLYLGILGTCKATASTTTSTMASTPLSQTSQPSIQLIQQ